MATCNPHPNAGVAAKEVNLPTRQDVYVEKQRPLWSYRTSILQVGRAGSPAAEYRTFLDFDLTSLAASGSKIIRAALVLHQGFYLFCSVALASATVNVVKRLIGRARPTLFDTVGDLHFNVGVWAYDYASFPSGHSTTSGAIFAGLALLYPRLGPFFAAFAIFFGFARIAVGAHYPSDVSAGLFYGTWISVLVACVFARYRLLFAVPERGLPVRRPHPRLRDRLRS